MNLTNEDSEEIEQNDGEVLEDREEIDSSTELEKKKKITNTYNAEGNIGQTQIFIQTLSNLNMDYKQSSNEMSINQPLKKYNLCNPNECSEFVEKYKDSEFVIVAIVLCTFENVALGDLPDLQEKLINYLPKGETESNEEGDGNYSRRNPYISLNTILSVIGGKRFITDGGQACVGLGENSKQALLNILELFPILRSSIATWLIHVNEVYKYRTTFGAYQIATAFARVISFDIADAEIRIFPKLCSRTENAGLLGIIMYKLYEDASLKEEIKIIIRNWIKSDSKWLWRPVCLAYSLLMQSTDHVSFESDLNSAINKRITYFNKSDMFFCASILLQSKPFRTMIAGAFHNACSKADTKEKRLDIANLYIYLIRRCYYLVNVSFIELPLVACDTNQQQKFLSQVIEQTMSDYHLRKQLYVILETYLKELSGYDFSVNVVNHIAAYFYNMTLSGLNYQKDVLYFLRNCENRASKQIYNRLYKAYEKEEN